MIVLLSACRAHKATPTESVAKVDVVAQAPKASELKPLVTVAFAFDSSAVAGPISAPIDGETKYYLVAGYADLQGAAAYNQDLSLRRAKAVAAALVGQGAHAIAIDIKAHGSSGPICTEARKACHARNRRVVVYSHQEAPHAK